MNLRRPIFAASAALSTLVACWEPLSDGEEAFRDCARRALEDGALMEETCDGIDNDCDGRTDEVGLALYRDLDGDGVGGVDHAEYVCTFEQARARLASSRYAAVFGDCDDTDDRVGAHGPEVCNGRDDDCNGYVDDVDLSATLIDGDGDGWGAPATRIDCDAAGRLAERGGDCDDDAEHIHPGAGDVCGDAPLDASCDGVIDCPGAPIDLGGAPAFRFDTAVATHQVVALEQGGRRRVVVVATLPGSVPSVRATIFDAPISGDQVFGASRFTVPLVSGATSRAVVAAPDVDGDGREELAVFVDDGDTLALHLFSLGTNGTSRALGATSLGAGALRRVERTDVLGRGVIGVAAIGAAATTRFVLVGVDGAGPVVGSTVVTDDAEASATVIARAGRGTLVVASTEDGARRLRGQEAPIAAGTVLARDGVDLGPVGPGAIFAGPRRREGGTPTLIEVDVAGAATTIAFRSLDGALGPVFELPAQGTPFARTLSAGPFDAYVAGVLGAGGVLLLGRADDADPDPVGAGYSPLLPSGVETALGVAGVGPGGTAGFYLAPDTAAGPGRWIWVDGTGGA